MKPLLISILLAILALLLLSCGGTRKTDLSRSETKTDNINIENSYSMGSKIVLMDLFKAKPIDALKPMWIDGKEYINAEISNDRSKTYLKTVTINTKYNITSIVYITTNKTTDKTNYIYLWLGMFLIVAISVLAYLVLKKLGFV